MLFIDIDVLKMNGASIMKSEEIFIYTEIIPPLNIVYMRRVGKYGIENKVLMEEFKSWVMQNGLFQDGAVILGIALDDANTVKPEQCRYDTCLVVPPEYISNDTRILQRNLEGGEYLVLYIPHTVTAVEKAWRENIPNLLKDGYRFDDSRPILERYKKEMVENHYCEICVPIY